MVKEDGSPPDGSTVIMYCLMIPFRSWGRGAPHDSCTVVELTGEAVKLVGEPDGTVMETYRLDKAFYNLGETIPVPDQAYPLYHRMVQNLIWVFFSKNTCSVFYHPPMQLLHS